MALQPILLKATEKSDKLENSPVLAFYDWKCWTVSGLPFCRMSIYSKWQENKNRRKKKFSNKITTVLNLGGECFYSNKKINMNDVAHGDTPTEIHHPNSAVFPQACAMF